MFEMYKKQFFMRSIIKKVLKKADVVFAVSNALKDEMCVCDIANVLGMSKSSISHQLGTLRRSGIVKCRKVGKEVFYMLDDEHIQKVFEIGVEHIEHRK